MAKNPVHRRKPLLPWYIGLAIVLAAVIYVGFQAYCTDCGAGPLPLFLVLVVVPVVYLVLMYLTFTSQDKSEK